MGYRVGWQCLETSEQAHDYVLSQMLPVITEEGQLIRPVKQGDNWYLNQSKIQLSFPQCSPVEQIQNGVLVAAPIFGLFVLVFGIRAIIRLVKSISAYEGVENDS